MLATGVTAPIDPRLIGACALVLQKLADRRARLRRGSELVTELREGRELGLGKL
jgi:hypothetical protein